MLYYTYFNCISEKNNEETSIEFRRMLNNGLWFVVYTQDYSILSIKYFKLNNVY